MKKIIILTSTLALLSTPVLAETPVFEIVIKDHKFNPANVEIPAGQKVKLVIKNQDPTPEEFESHDFNREKVISGNSEGIVFVGPLDAGEYKFFGEFHEKTAQGKLVVK
jgi:plastocyanin